VRQKLSVLGATGSIGDSTLDVAARHPELFEIHALVANIRVDEMLARIERFRPNKVVMNDETAARQLRVQVASKGLSTQVFGGQAAAIDAACEADTVMAAIVGAAGLAPTIAAARLGRRILLANKEALVMAGPLFVQACRDSNALVLPIDSEHNAIFQCLPNSTEVIANRQALVPSDLSRVSHLVLTASGGPFRDFTLQQMATVTPEQAIAHPNWAMGRKISVDSATLMNKGLELIEACLLFGLSADRIEVVVHPQSIIHSMVQFIDGSLLAQMGQPDMRTPIAHCMAWPDRFAAGVAPLNLLKVARLDFKEPDEQKFACLQLARQAWRIGPAAPCVLNAANEIAVGAFLEEKIGFLDIARINEIVMNQLGHHQAPISIEQVLDLNEQSRQAAQQIVNRFSNSQFAPPQVAMTQAQPSTRDLTE
jgi:1-deoxy-D-xylulose-5-phosphate reductoisomerase